MITPRRPGLFLDLDGTLANSVPALRRVYLRFLAHFGYEGSDDEFDRLNGPKLTEIITVLKATYRLEIDGPELLDFYNGLVDHAYTEVLPYPNSLEAVASAHERGWVVSVVTSNLAARTWAWLERNRFSSYVSTVVSGEEVEHGKPSPDLYDLAQHRVATERSLSLAVEDSLAGIQAARASGLHAIMFFAEPTGPPRLPDDIDWMTNWNQLSRFLVSAPSISKK